METKQVIVMRKDLNMRKGKMVAQGAHASLKVFFDLARSKIRFGNTIKYTISFPEGAAGLEMDAWVEGIFTKITCSVNSEEELLAVYNSALEQKIPCSLIQDVGKTEFNGVSTYTCCAIGPANIEAVNKITGHLPLL